ncbi:hypothetical protein [Lactiplantibacillus plantarum]|uniref:hypothetical protein n=1 Tax=Lactiplantibacillus plantarum TaxID=1590 RepID=UPI000629FBCA|nr:hypothetical protein [Lactiplantibacillus plantarum]
MKIYTNMVNEFSDIIESSLHYAYENKINKILIFSKNGDSALALKKQLSEKNTSIKIMAILFPANEHFFKRDNDGNVEEFIPNSPRKGKINILEQAEIQPIYGTLPFENVIVPGTTNNIYSTIKQTLSLVSPGLQLAVQGVLMATDQGFLSDNEHVISIVSDISVDITSANSRLMFHPQYGLNINHIIAQKKKQN